MEAIRSLNIEIIQTYGEADRYIAHQASRVYNCPVLSNDSDFLIYSSVELVLLRSIDFESEDENGIRCQIFKRKAFLNYFGLQSDTFLPLAAALLGNDETGTKSELNQVVDKIFSQIKHEKRKNICPRHQRISAILKRLGREAEYNDIELVLDKLIQPLSAGKLRENARKVVLDAIESYRFICDKNICENQTCQCCYQDSLWTENELASRIKDEYEIATYPNWFMDIIRHKNFFFQSQIEDSESYSCVYVCLPIIYSIASVLSNSESLECSINARREGKKLSVIHLSAPQKDEKNIDELLEIEDMVFSNFVLHFWCKTCDVSKMELTAVILYILLQDSFEEFFTQNLNNDNYNILGCYDRETVHSLSNFQAITYFTTCLNKLQKFSQKNFFSMKYWSGYNLYRIIHGFKSPEDVQNLIKTNEKAELNHANFEKLFKKFEPLTSRRIHVSFHPKRKRLRNWCQRRTKIEPEVENNSSESNENSSQSGNDEDDNLCNIGDLNNRFNLLQLASKAE